MTLTPFMLKVNRSAGAPLVFLYVYFNGLTEIREVAPVDSRNSDEEFRNSSDVGQTAFV
jgi:hypothetical protein